MKENNKKKKKEKTYASISIRVSRVSTIADRTKSLIYRFHRHGGICIGRRNEMRHNRSHWIPGSIVAF